MRALTHKLVRDLARRRVQYLAIVLVIAIGIAGQVASGGLLSSLSGARDEFYAAGRFADVFVPLKRAPLAALDDVARLPGVRAFGPRVIARGIVLDERLPEPASLELASWPVRGLNLVTLAEGRAPAAGSDEVVIGTAFAEAWGLHAGDRLEAVVNGRRIMLAVSGLGDSPEYVYQIAPGDMLPDYRRHTVAWMEHERLAALAGLEGAFNDLAVALAPGASEEPVIAALDRALARYGAGGSFGRKEQLSHRFIENELEELRVHATIVPLIFLGAAAFLLHLVVSRQVRRERELIGMLKAYGYTSGAIALHYLSLGLLLFAAGSIAGIALGTWLGNLLAGLYVEFFRFPQFSFRLDLAGTALGLLVAGGAVASGTLAGVAAAVRLAPAEAMRPPSPPMYHPLLLDRVRLGHLLGTLERMVVRHLERGALRTALTIAGLALACGLVAFAGFQRDAIDYMTAFQFEMQDRSDLTLTFTEPVPGRAAQELMRMPGVLAAEPFRAVAVRLRRGHATYRAALEAWEPGGRLRRLLDRDEQPVVLPPQGALMSAELARMLGIVPGDRVEAELLEGERQRLSIPVAGLLDDYVGVGVYVTLDELHRLLGEQDAVSGLSLAVTASRRAPLMRELARLPRVAGIARRERRIESFQESFGQSLLIVAYVFLVIAGTLSFGIVFNAARTVMDERRRELATLRVLGFSLPEAAYVLVAELALVTLIALPFGLALGYGLAAFLAGAMRSELFRVPLILEGPSYGRAAVVLLVAAAVSVAWALADLARLGMKEALDARD